MSEPAETQPNHSANTRQQRMARKKLDATIAFASNVFVACLILMWSVFNTWANVLQFFNNDIPGQAWWVTALMVLLLCVVPFGLGMWLLFYTLQKYKPS